MSFTFWRSEVMFTKTNRVDRFKQMSKQQQLIEEKKRQIQERQEQQKKLKEQKQNSTETTSEKKPLVFSNDGTFLDQFKKLSGIQGGDLEQKEGATSPPQIKVEDESSEKEVIQEDSHEGKEKTEIKEEDVKDDCGSSGEGTVSRGLVAACPPPPLPPADPHWQGHLHPSQLPGPAYQPPPFQPPQPYPPPQPHYQPPPYQPPPQPMPHFQQQPPPHVQPVPPPLGIPPPPLPPLCPPPPQFCPPQGQFPQYPQMPAFAPPPPPLIHPQVRAEKIQGNSQSETYIPPLEKDQLPGPEEWYPEMQNNNNPMRNVNHPIGNMRNMNNNHPGNVNIHSIKEEEDMEFKQEPSDYEQRSMKSGERKRKSRWSDKKEIMVSTPKINVTGMSGHMISKVTRTDPGLLQYATTAYGSTNLSEEDWKKAEENYKVHLLYQDMMMKRAEVERLSRSGKNKYEYDSDEEIDDQGTWEHKLREKEMQATRDWADSLTEMAKGKHHIGDFLPPDELNKFMAKYQAVKGGGEPDLSDYKEYKLGEDNKGFQMLQKLGWSEGQGLGSTGHGRLDPVNKAKMRDSNEGLGHSRPDDITNGDDEYEAYRKRMMLAYRFRPNPLNNPRRPYY